MRIAPLALGLLLFVAPPAPAADDDADVVVKRWLVLPTVDVVARRPLRPDAVFAKHLLDRASPPPKDGDEIVGTLGKPAKWTPRAADEKGETDGDGIGWAYASVESAEGGVAIAKLEGAAVLFVGGAGFTGDVYRLGDAGVPVALKKGANDVYVGTLRGAFRLTLLHLGRLQRKYKSGTDGILPDDADTHAEAGEDVGSRRLINVTPAEVASIPGTPFVPLGVRRLAGFSSESTLPTPPRAHRRMFTSNIDGSEQSYALVPPAPSDIDKSKIGLVLSLHGASVECMDQAKAYAPKPDFWIVCPTNRGRFGFDWQDWGRLDAYEVLDDALKVTGVDPRRVYLTGHSMGGHGTWHLAANDPDRFLAIAPSAGWCSWDTYVPSSQATSPLAWMWRAADGASRTLDLVGNLAQIPTYVLHGEKDDNVPLSEAQMMVDAVTKAGGKPEFHVEPGAGHWWDKDEKKPGADCVDWPGIWELFRKTQPTDVGPGAYSFTTTDLSVLSRQGWMEIVEPIEYGRPSRVTAARVKSDFVVTTENVRRIRIGADGSFITKENARVVIDGKSCEFGTNFRGDDGIWRRHAPTDKRLSDTKSPERSGPFKQAFTNRFVLVYGTAGDDAENRELLEKARYDSEVWAYRANGDANLMSDAQFLAGDFADRNVIVYGNADTNKAWSAVFDDDCPIVAKRGAITVGGVKHEGVVAAAFVHTRKGQGRALAAAFADTGAAATRLFYSFPVFGSGFGIPDYVVFGAGYLKEMDGDVRAAGWFDYAWRMK